jgi:biopolymer transport protein ExbD
VKLRSHLDFRSEMMLVAPVVDVFATLLLFFLLGSSLVSPSGVRIELPPSSFSLQGLAEAHVLVVSAGTPPKLLLNDRETGLDRLESDLKDLAAADRTRLGRVSTLVLKMDQTTSHGLAMKVKNLALSTGFRVAEAAQPAENP